MRALTLLMLIAPGCANTCPEGFTESDAGVCLRNHYGEPHVDTNLPDDDTGADSGGSGDEAPVVVFNTGRFGTDAEGVPFLEVVLTATDAQGDLEEGNVHMLLDDTVNLDRPIVLGNTDAEDYASALLDGTDLWFWVADVAPGDHSGVISVEDAAGNISGALTVTFSDTPQ